MHGPGDERDDEYGADPGDYQTEEQLTLADEDEALPWLESDEDEAEGGFDGRIIAFALIGLLVVAGILLAGWWLVRNTSDENLVADGSTIEAPDEPYKMRPEDPGGAEVAGTGDVSFEVAEGEGLESRLAEEDDVPAPSIDREQAGRDTEEAEQESGPGVGVQVGAFSTREAASSGWSQLTARYEDLQGMRYRILEGTADSGTIYRLQAVAANASAADALCRSIRNAGGDCQVKD